MKQTLVLVFSTVMLFMAEGVNGDFSFASQKEFNVTRIGCGLTKLCVGMPDNCDPEGNGTCLFGSVNITSSAPPNGVEMAFQLSGNSSGFIALGLTANASEGTSMLFICAQNSTTGSFFFQTKTLNNTNNMLTSLNRNVTEIRGKAINDTIQCEFNVPSLNATSTTRNAADTTFVLLLGSGTVNGSSLENFIKSKTTDPLNLGNLTSNIPSTSTPPGSGANNGPQSHAVLLLLSVLTLFFLKTA